MLKQDISAQRTTSRYCRRFVEGRVLMRSTATPLTPPASVTCEKMSNDINCLLIIFGGGGGVCIGWGWTVNDARITGLDSTVRYSLELRNACWSKTFQNTETIADAAQVFCWRQGTSSSDELWKKLSTGLQMLGNLLCLYSSENKHVSEVKCGWDVKQCVVLSTLGDAIWNKKHYNTHTNKVK